MVMVKGDLEVVMKRLTDVENGIVGASAVV